MPRVNPPSATSIKAWVKDIPELQYDGIGSMLFCTVCNITFWCSQKTHISQHIATQKHKTNTGGYTQTHFNRDLMEVMTVCNISWNTLNNPSFRQFLNNCIGGKYAKVTLPSESCLRKCYLPQECNRIKSDIFNKIGDSYIWLSVDEISNASGRVLVCVKVGTLDQNTPTQTCTFACKELPATETITSLVHASLRDLWGDKFEQSSNKLLLFVTNGAPNMKCVGETLQTTYVNMLHLTCLVHALNEVAETIKTLCPKVNQFMSNMKQVFSKAPQRVRQFRQMLPRIQLPPEPDITRWGAWLEAVSYYYSHFDDIRSVIEQFDSAESQAIFHVKEAFLDADVINNLTHIHFYFSQIPLAIRKLEKSKLPLTAAMNIVFDLRHHLFQLSGGLTEAVKSKFEAALKSNPGFHTMCSVVRLLDGNEVDFSSPNLNLASLKHYQDFKYAPITSVGIDRSFLKVKRIFNDRRRTMTAQHLEALLIVDSIRIDGECKESDESE